MTVEVDLRIARIEDPAGDDVAALSTAERTHLWRFHREADRRAHIAGRSIVRRHLAQYCGLPPSRVPLALGENGRPRTTGGPSFSIAHAGEYVAVAFCTRNVGVDVEPVRPLDDVDELILAHAHPLEQASFARLSHRARAIAFLTLWVRKEAILKACGTGLAIAPHGVDVRADHVTFARRTWRLLNVSLDAHVAALCVDAERDDDVRVVTHDHSGTQTLGHSLTMHTIANG